MPSRRQILAMLSALPFLGAVGRIRPPRMVTTMPKPFGETGVIGMDVRTFLAETGGIGRFVRIDAAVERAASNCAATFTVDVTAMKREYEAWRAAKGLPDRRM